MWQVLRVQYPLNRNGISTARKSGSNSVTSEFDLIWNCTGFEVLSRRWLWKDPSSGIWRRVVSQPVFRRNMSPPSSESKNKPRKKPEWKQVARKYEMDVDSFILSKDEPMGTEFQSSTYPLFPIYTGLPTRWAGWAFSLPPACLLVLLNLFLRPWRWRRYFPPKRRLELNGLHGVVSQKMILFITTAVKTSNPTNVILFEQCAITSHYRDLWTASETNCPNRRS
jgi:hypothetical protein